MTTFTEACPSKNVLRDQTPTFSGWNTDPSGDVDRLTDGSLATAMTSGSKTLTAGWQYAYIDFTIPNGIYLVGGYGKMVCAAADAICVVVTSSSKSVSLHSIGEDNGFFTPCCVMVDDGVLRYGLTTDGASTMSVEFYELFATRVA